MKLLIVASEVMVSAALGIGRLRQLAKSQLPSAGVHAIEPLRYDLGHLSRLANTSCHQLTFMRFLMVAW